MGKKKGEVKPVAAKVVAVKKKPVGKDFKSTHPHLFAKDAKDFRVGRDIQPKRDLSRFVKWPRYVRLQRQRAILKKRLKVPPSINQFTKTLDKNNADTLFRLLAKYRPEPKADKKKRLVAKAKQEKAAADKFEKEKKEKESKKADQKVQEKKVQDKKEEKKKGDKKKKEGKPTLLKYGINHVCALVEAKKAKLVVIAHDVDPIEIVVWLPALCRKMDVPYCIIKGKERLGTLVHKKTATAVVVTEVHKEDAGKLEQVIASARQHFNNDASSQRMWGDGILGAKAQAVVKKREKAAAREAVKKQ